MCVCVCVFECVYVSLCVFFYILHQYYRLLFSLSMCMHISLFLTLYCITDEETSFQKFYIIKINCVRVFLKLGNQSIWFHFTKFISKLPSVF